LKTPAHINGRTGPRGKSRTGPALGPALWLLVLILVFPTPAARAAQPSAEEASAESETEQVEILIPGQELITIRADRIEQDEDLDLTRLSGRVSIRRGLELLTADWAVWRNQTKVAEVIGSVHLETPDFTMDAERAVVNLELSLAKIYEGRAFFHQTHYYLNGTVIERLSEKKLQVTEATATTCDGPTPPWTIQAEHLTVTENGYASARGVIFKGVGSTLPFLATPYFIFPVKTERQTGFLRPGSLSNSSQNGLTLSLPFFWATGENHDLTYTPVWREKRGLSSTLEGRYHLDWGRGIWQVSHLNDQADRFYDLYSYLYSGTPREKKKAEERFWLRAHNQGRFGDWDVHLNLDMASDPLYIKEFTTDPDGFNQSSKAFASNFGHTINEALNPNRANEVYAQKLDGPTQVRTGLHYTQNLNSKDNRETLQRLPAIQYDLVGHSLDEIPTSGHQSPRLSLSTGYDHFYRQTEENSRTTETGHRMRLQPAVDWTTALGLANLKVTGGLDMAAYAADGRRPSKARTLAEAEHERWYNLVTGSAEVELGTTFSRVFEGGPGRAVATRHQITPTLAFNYVGAPENQGRLPYWDHHDRRMPRQTLRYGLSNSLVAKNPGRAPAQTPAQTPDQEPGRPQADDKYFQFLKFGLWASYELADNSHLTSRLRDPDDSSRYYDTNYYDRGSGPLEAYLEAFFNPYFSARMISNFNTRTGRAINHDLSLTAADGRGDRLTLTYDHDTPEGKPVNTPGYQEARANLLLKLNSEWSSRFSTRYDLQGNQALQSTAQLAYQAQCYGLSLLYSKTYHDESVGLVFDFLGLGSLEPIDLRDVKGFVMPE